MRVSPLPGGGGGRRVSRERSRGTRLAGATDSGGCLTMPLNEDRRFGRTESAISPDALRSILVAQRRTLGSAPWVHCGYEPLPAIDGLRSPVIDISARVDNAFRLGPTLGFETSPIIVTTGLR